MNNHFYYLFFTLKILTITILPLPILSIEEVVLIDKVTLSNDKGDLVMLYHTFVVPDLTESIKIDTACLTEPRQDLCQTKYFSGGARAHAYPVIPSYRDHINSVLYSNLVEFEEFSIGLNSKPGLISRPSSGTWYLAIGLYTDKLIEDNLYSFTVEISINVTLNYQLMTDSIGVNRGTSSGKLDLNFDSNEVKYVVFRPPWSSFAVELSLTGASIEGEISGLRMPTPGHSLLKSNFLDGLNRVGVIRLANTDYSKKSCSIALKELKGCHESNKCYFEPNHRKPMYENYRNYLFSKEIKAKMNSISVLTFFLRENIDTGGVINITVNFKDRELYVFSGQLSMSICLTRGGLVDAKRYDTTTHCDYPMHSRWSPNGPDITLEILYPPYGYWSLQVRVQCSDGKKINCNDNNFNTTIIATVRSLDCTDSARMCSSGYACVMQTKNNLIYMHCQQSKKLGVFALVILTCSTIGFGSAAILCFLRHLWAPSVIYFYTMIISIFYHICHCGYWCLMKPEVLFSLDIYSALVALFTTILVVAWGPKSISNVISISMQLFIVVCLMNNISSLITAFIILIFSSGTWVTCWIIIIGRCGRIFPTWRYYLLHLAPGLFFGIIGLFLLLATFQEWISSEKYGFVHSLGHCFTSIAIIFLLPKPAQWKELYSWKNHNLIDFMDEDEGYTKPEDENMESPILSMEENPKPTKQVVDKKDLLKLKFNSFLDDHEEDEVYKHHSPSPIKGETDVEALFEGVRRSLHSHSVSNKMVETEPGADDENPLRRPGQKEHDQLNFKDTCEEIYNEIKNIFRRKMRKITIRKPKPFVKNESE